MNDSNPLLKFGIFTVICIGFAAWIVALIGNISLEDRRSYVAYFEDASGLVVGDAVKISGVTIGKVNGVSIHDGREARVDFNVRSDIDLGADSTLTIRWRDVIGLRFLYVEPGVGPGVDEGHEFPSENTTAPADIGVFLTQLTPVMEALDPQVSNLFVEAMAEALVGREAEVRQLIKDGASLTSAIATRDQELERLLINSADILDAYAQREQDLQALITSLASVGTTLSDRNDSLITAITTIDDGAAELGDLLRRNDGEIRTLLDELDAAASVLSVNRDNLERVVTYLGEGVGSYHRVTTIGQYFNVRGVCGSVNYQPFVPCQKSASLIDNQGNENSFDSPAGAQQGTTGALASLFGNALAAIEGGR